MATAATTTAASRFLYGSNSCRSQFTTFCTFRLHHPTYSCRSHLLLRGDQQSRLPVGNGFCGDAARVKRSNVNVIVVCELEPCLEDSAAVQESADTNVAVPGVGGDVDVGKSGGAESGVSVRPGVDDGSGYGDSFGGSGGNGKFSSGGGGGGGGGGRGGGDGGHNEEFDEETSEFGPLLKFEEVMRETKSRGVVLPPDMFEAAKFVGIRQVILENYFNLQGAAWPLGYAIESWSLLRNRMLVDRHFLFKIGTEIVIDSCCATFAEIQKRGKDFWSEFELYTADLLVGVVVNIALVGMLAPYARLGRPTATNGLFGRLRHAYGALPSSVFEAERPGCKFTIQQRVATYFYKGMMHGVAGFTCGLIGQGIANMIMMVKRNVRKSEEDIPVPPLVKSAALWGVFLGVSSNTRYQIINGLERVVEGSSVAKRLPLIAMGFTVGIRFSNNVYGGMQFVDWARWSGCQ